MPTPKAFRTAAGSIAGFGRFNPYWRAFQLGWDIGNKLYDWLPVPNSPQAQLAAPGTALLTCSAGGSYLVGAPSATCAAALFYNDEHLGNWRYPGYGLAFIWAASNHANNITGSPHQYTGKPHVRYAMPVTYIVPNYIRAPAPNYRTQPVLPGWVDPLTDPAVDPLALPEPFAPVAAPWRVQPHRQPNPFRPVREQSGRGYGDPARSDPDPYKPWVRPDPGGRSITPRGVDVRPAGLREPPRKGDKEGKVNSPWLKLAQGMLHSASEAADAIDAIYGALPKGSPCRIPYRPGQPIMAYEKAMAIGGCFGDIDWNQAGINLIKNELGDMAAGLAGRANRIKRPDGIDWTAIHTPYGTGGGGEAAAGAAVGALLKQLGL